MIPETTGSWMFWVLVLGSFCCSALGFATKDTGWYVLGVILALGAFGVATALATVAPQGAS